MSIVKSKLNNIQYINEDNYNILNKETQVWRGKLPYTVGSKFPTADIIERAAISRTNKLIFNNDIEDIYANLLSVVPEIDPMFGWQIRELIMNLPYFKNATNSWVGLIAGEAPQVDGKEEIDLQINEVLESSNWSAIMQSEVRGRFLDVIGAYRVDVDILGRPTIVGIDVKNLCVFMSKDFTTSVEVSVIFNIYKEQNRQYVEFIEYHYDGKIVKTTFAYNDGIIGKKIEAKCDEGEAFNGKHKMSPIVLFKHNAGINDIYGTDQFRYWSSAVMAAMRALQNVLRLGERTREMIRKVPESAIKKDPATGANVFLNNGTVSYPNGDKENTPEIEYIVPEIRMEEAILSLEKALKEIGTSTGLGTVFGDIEKLGTNLSAKSIEAALYPTKLEARRITTEMLPSMKELVIKLCAMGDIELKPSDFTINMYDGFPKDRKEETDAIQSRLAKDTKSISLADAIRILDRVPARIALQKANEIEGINNKEDKATIGLDINNNDGKIESHELNPTAGDGIVELETKKEDDTLFETQLYPAPQDIGG